MRPTHYARQAYALGGMVQASRDVNNRRMGEPKKFLGLAIAQLRAEKRVTQEKIEGVAGVSQSSLSRIEKGKQGLSMESLASLAGALEVPVSVIWARAEALSAGKAPAAWAPAEPSEPSPEDRLAAIEDASDQLDIIIPTLIRIVTAKLPGAAAELAAALRPGLAEGSRSLALASAIDAAEEVQQAEAAASLRAAPRASSARPRRSAR